MTPTTCNFLTAKPIWAQLGPPGGTPETGIVRW